MLVRGKSLNTSVFIINRETGENQENINNNSNYGEHEFLKLYYTKYDIGTILGFNPHPPLRAGAMRPNARRM
jgi:hypothetical protein